MYPHTHSRFLKPLVPIALFLFSNFCFCQVQSPVNSDKNQDTEIDSSQIPESNEPTDLTQELLDDYFTAPLTKLVKLRYPPVTDIETLYKRINAYKVTTDHFEIAYHRIKLLNSFIENHILHLVYEYENKIDTAFAYYKPALIKNDKKVGVNVIPGSRRNQSSGMYYNQKNNIQQNMDDIAQHYGDVYILVKPNEDFLAIHNGKKKLSEVSFVNYLLNNGSSYSVYYMIQGLALSKFIKFEYEQLYVCGLSQGGYAALINALQSNPQKAIVASGYTVLFDQPYVSGHDQLIIPGIGEVYNSEGVRMQIQETNTQFLFTWGLKEPGAYGIDARDSLTLKFFDQLTNVKCYIHPKGHIYYGPAIREFLDGK